MISLKSASNRLFCHDVRTVSRPSDHGGKSLSAGRREDEQKGEKGRLSARTKGALW